MKNRILAFVMLIVIAIAWHFFLIRNKSLAPSAETSDPDLMQERNPATPEHKHSGAALKPPSPRAFGHLGDFEHELSRLESCYNSMECQFSKLDVHTYRLAVSQAAAKTLAALVEQVKTAHIQSEAIVRIAISSLHWSEDHVRMQSLALLSTQKPNPAALLGVMACLRAGHDSSIYKQALQEMRRYDTVKERSLVDNFLVDTIQNGSFYAAATVAGDLIPFLSEKNLARFQGLLSKLDPATLRYKALEQSLREFDHH